MGRIQVDAANHSIQSDSGVQNASTAQSDPIEDNSICYGGCPKGAPATNQTVTHHIIILSNNPDTKFADWVAYRIGRDTIGNHCIRHWERDPDLGVDDTLNPPDYAGLREALKSDRGHQAPLASLCGSQYWQEADYLSNVTPQKTDLNEGAWERLEEAERAIVSNGNGEVRSVTGTLYERAMPPLPRSHIPAKVPSGYWKVISVMDGGKLNAIAFLMDQATPKETDYCATNIRIGALEARTHLMFFPNLSNSNRDSVELGNADSELKHALGC
jgi:endonuclease G